MAVTVESQRLPCYSKRIEIGSCEAGCYSNALSRQRISSIYLKKRASYHAFVFRVESGAPLTRPHLCPQRVEECRVTLFSFSNIANMIAHVFMFQ